MNSISITIKKMLPIALMLSLLLPMQASAHGASPLHTETLHVGGYDLTVEFYNWPIRVEQTAAVRIVPQTPLPSRAALQLQATLVPAPGVPDQPRPLTVGPDSDSDLAYSVDVRALVTGEWQLQISAAGAAGSGVASMRMPVAGPPRIPVWLGWLIGLTPLLGLLIFISARLRRLPRHTSAW